MYPAIQGLGQTCSACEKAVSAQSVQRCKDCNKGYCADCFKQRNDIENSTQKEKGKCIPCENTILIVQIQIQDKASVSQSHGAQGHNSHAASLPSRNTSQSASKLGGGSVMNLKGLTSGYSEMMYGDEMYDEDDYDYDEMGYGQDFGSLPQKTRRKQQTASKGKDRDCPIYIDKNGNRVPFAMILAGAVVEYYKVSPLTGNREFSTSTKGSYKHSSGFSMPKNKNARMKQNGQLVEEKEREDEYGQHGKNQYHGSKESSNGDFIGQSNEKLEVKKENTPNTAVNSTHNDLIKNPLTVGTDIPRAETQQREKSGKGHSLNVKDLRNTHLSFNDEGTIGYQHRPPVAMILAGLAGEEYLQEALQSRVTFVDRDTQQFSSVSRSQDHSTARSDTVISKQKSMKNKNLILTKSSVMVKELTENNGKNSTEGAASNATKMPTAVEDTKQSQSSSTSADQKEELETLKLQGKSAKEPVKRQQSDKHAKDQERAHIGKIENNRSLYLGNSKSIIETYEKDEKLRTSKRESESTEIKGLKSNHVLMEKSTDTVIEDIKQDYPTKNQSFDYDKAKKKTIESVPKTFETTSDNTGTSQMRSVSSVPVKIPESPTNENSDESDSDDEVIPYALRIAGYHREPRRKKGKTKSGSDKPFALRLSMMNKNPPQESYTTFQFSLRTGQDNKKDTQSDIDVKSGNAEDVNVHFLIYIPPRSSGPKVTEIDTEENDLKSTEGGKNDTSMKTDHQNIIKSKNKNQATSKKVAGFDTGTKLKIDDMPTQIEEDSTQGVDKSDNGALANSKNNPQEQMVTGTTKKENNSVDEKRTGTSLAYTVSDMLKNPHPNVQSETSSAVGVSDEAMPSVMGKDQSRTSWEENGMQTSKRAKIETSTQDIHNMKEEVDHSKSQFHTKSKTPSQPSGIMKNSYFKQSSTEKEKDGQSNQNLTRQEVRTLETGSAKNQPRRTDELRDSPNTSDIDHSEIHRAFQNIGRKRAQRSTLCCMGCGRPECQSNVMQSMLLMNQTAKKYGLQVCDVNPDGNCMFTAVADQLLFLGDSRFDAWNLRQHAVDWLKNNPCSKDGTHYSSFLDSESWEEYLLRLSQDTQWGDHIILRATAEFLERSIEVLTPKETIEFHRTKIEPEFNKSGQDDKSVLLLGHVGESHYVSLRSEELRDNEKPHEIEEKEMHKKITQVEKRKDEERENPQIVSPDCREKVQMFEETYIDTWSDCPGIHLSFALKKTFSPATVRQEANSVSNEMVSHESDMQNYYPRNSVNQRTFAITLVGSVIEGLYCPNLDVPAERGLSYDWGEMTEISVRQDLQIIKRSHISDSVNHLYMEEDTVHPGFVRLISASLLVQQAHGTNIPGSPIKYVGNNHFKSPKQPAYQYSIKLKKIKVRDIVGIRCSYWPKSAEKWASRKRFEGWPLESIIQDIVNEGCLVLPVSHKKSQYPDVEFQISFALAEKKLCLQAVSDDQHYCYVIWKAICNQVFKGKNLLGAIFYKTVFFFACETIPAEHWRSHPGPCIFFMFDELLKCIREENMPSYFLPTNNLLDAVDAEKLKTVEEILRSLRSDILLHVRLLMETTYKPTEILEKVIDNIQTFKFHRNARITTLELFVPESIELAKESVRNENYKEGYDRLTQAYEERLAVCTCDDQIPINLFIHGAISDVGIIPTTWFLLYCDEHFQGQLATSLMQEMSTYHGQEVIRIGHVLPADISGKYVDAQVPQQIARDLCSFSSQFAKYLNHIGSTNHALQVLYYCIHRHKEWEQKASQPVLTGEEHQQTNSKEYPDHVNDFTYYNMLNVYITLHKVYITRNEIQLLRQHLVDIVQLVERIGSASAFWHLSLMLGDLGDKEAKAVAYTKYQELHQKEAEVRKEMEASRV